jgi:hypothetical protein
MIKGYRVKIGDTCVGSRPGEILSKAAAYRIAADYIDEGANARVVKICTKQKKEPCGCEGTYGCLCYAR